MTYDGSFANGRKILKPRPMQRRKRKDSAEHMSRSALLTRTVGIPKRSRVSRLILALAFGSRSRHSCRRYSADRPKPDGLGSAKRVRTPDCATRVGAH